MFKNYSNAKTPITSDNWRNLNEESRIKNVTSVLQESDYFKDFQVIKADQNGQVVINLDKNIPSDKRGLLLKYASILFTANIAMASLVS